MQQCTIHRHPVYDVKHLPPDIIIDKANLKQKKYSVERRSTYSIYVQFCVDYKSVSAKQSLVEYEIIPVEQCWVEYKTITA